MANQPLPTITVTFNPSGNSLTCNPASVAVAKGNTGQLTVNLQLISGASGSIAFQSNPVTWSTTPPASFNVQANPNNSAQISITAPNNNTGPNAQSYSFQVSYTYTPVNGPVRTGTGDPTIILEGTGSKEDGGS